MNDYKCIFDDNEVIVKKFNDENFGEYIDICIYKSNEDEILNSVGISLKDAEKLSKELNKFIK